MFGFGAKAGAATFDVVAAVVVADDMRPFAAAGGNADNIPPVAAPVAAVGGNADNIPPVAAPVAAVGGNVDNTLPVAAPVAAGNAGGIGVRAV